MYALDTATGCIHWTFQANGPVRSSLLAVSRGSGHAIVFGDLVGWMYALDSATGQLLWKARPEEHEGTRLTGGAVEHDGVIFIPVASWEEARALGPAYECCTFRGSIVALRAADGQQVWKTYTIDGPATVMGTTAKDEDLRPSGAGMWAAPKPAATRGVISAATGYNYSTPPTKTSDALMAINMKTGRIVWVRQVTSGDAYNSACGNNSGNCPEEKGPDYDFGSSALLVTAGGRDLVVAGQKSGVVTAVDPARNGEIVWQTRVGKGGVNGGVQWGMASDGAKIYASVSDVVRIPNANPAPGDTARFILSPTEGGGLTALTIADGKKVWSVQPPPCRTGAPRLQPGAIGRAIGDAGPRVFGIARRAPARVRHGERPGRVGRGHRARLRRRQRRKRPGRFARRRRFRHFWWHALRQLRLLALRRHAGQRPARIRGQVVQGFSLAVCLS